MGDDKVLDVTAPVLGISRPRHRDECKQLEASTKTWREPHPSDVKAPVQYQTPRSVNGLKFAYPAGRLLNTCKAAYLLR